MTGAKDESPKPASRPCPICHQPVEPGAKTAPFCSERCRNVDLYRWWNGKYAIVEPLRPEHVDPDTLDSGQ